MPRAGATVAALAILGVTGSACGGGNGDGAADGKVVTFQRPAPAPKTATLRPARARLFTLRAPAGWPRTDSTLSGGLERSEWREPAAPGTSVLVDAIAGARSAPADRARRNRDRGAAKPGYREHALEPVTLAGRDAYVWDYELPDRRVVDYFFNDCGDGFAVQGSAPATGFARLAPEFRAVAASLRSTHC
jgi:hypothetical protein